VDNLWQIAAVRVPNYRKVSIKASEETTVDDEKSIVNVVSGSSGIKLI
jgi:hypothetical protein